MHTGLVALGTVLPVSMITAAQFQTDLTAFITQDGAFNARRSARQAVGDGWQVALAGVYDWLLAVRALLVARWGTGWSAQWAQAGFVSTKTAVPSTVAGQLGLNLSLVNFFTANPTYEVPTMNLTAAHGTVLRTAALNAQAAVAAATVLLNQTGEARQAAFDTLVAAVKAVMKNLEVVLAPDDPRWLTFGLLMPSTITTPGQPLNVTAQQDAQGNILVQCDAVALATRYRCRMLLVGVETDYRLVASGTEPLLSIAGVVPGQTAQLIVQAVNGSLQGVPSEPIQFTVPLASALAEAAKPAATPERAAVKALANGNGHSNGHDRTPHARAA